MLKLSLVIIVLAVFLVLPVAFCQEEVPKDVLSNEDVGAQKLDVEAMDENIDWVWGEVISIDKNKKELAVKYVDYDTEKEQEMTIAVTDKTEFENAASLDEVKKGDFVSIDYEIVQDKKEASLIIVETLEEEDIEEPEL